MAMAANVSEFAWTATREKAARLVAEDTLSDQKIADECGISERQLARWKLHPVFRARVQEHVATWRERVMQQGIADRAARVASLNERWAQLKAVIAARAADPLYQRQPGGKTGLLARQVKLSATGREVDDFAVDVALLKELREHEKQAAQELGQWAEKREVSGPNGGPVIISEVVVNLPPDPSAEPDSPDHETALGADGL